MIKYVPQLPWKGTVPQAAEFSVDDSAIGNIAAEPTNFAR